MISDVLSDAVAKIRRYLDDVDTYSDPMMRVEIWAVVDRMQALRARLDTLPLPVPTENCDAGHDVPANTACPHCGSWPDEECKGV